jgi:glucose dehydrogenase
MGRLKHHAIAARASAAVAVALLTPLGLVQQPALRTNIDAGPPVDALPGDWLGYGRSQSETPFNPLRQIDISNVSRLGLAWTYTLGAGGGN